MPLPDFNDEGDLPEGVYRATWDEVVARFGHGSPQRQEVTARLQRIRELALGTGFLDRLVLFGSFVTTKAEPNDVDVVLVMTDYFPLSRCPEAALAMFDHRRAADEFGASIFWIRPGMLLGQTLDEFIAGWQIKRDRRRRGI